MRCGACRTAAWLTMLANVVVFCSILMYIWGGYLLPWLVLEDCCCCCSLFSRAGSASSETKGNRNIDASLRYYGSSYHRERAEMGTGKSCTVGHLFPGILVLWRNSVLTVSCMYGEILILTGR